MEELVAVAVSAETEKKIEYAPFCPICESPKEHKGSHNIKICADCAGILFDQIEEKTI